MHIGVKVDKTVKLKSKLVTTQSVPESMCENLNLNVSIIFINIIL